MSSQKHSLPFFVLPPVEFSLGRVRNARESVGEAALQRLHDQRYGELIGFSRRTRTTRGVVESPVGAPIYFLIQL